MDKELMELFEQRLMIFSKRDDVEKLRQETNANFRRLREENKELILGWLEGIRTEIEGLRKEIRVDTEPILEVIKEEIKRLELKIESVLFQSIEPSLRMMKEEASSTIQQSKADMESNLQRIREETNAAFLQSRQEITSYLQLIREDGKTNFTESHGETNGKIERLNEKVGYLNDQTEKTIEEIAALGDKIKAGFSEVREELGSMIKFSYADLEKRFTTLEARVKALEKLILP